MYDRSFRSYFHIKWKFLVTSRIFLAASTLFLYLDILLYILYRGGGRNKCKSFIEIVFNLDDNFDGEKLLRRTLLPSFNVNLIRRDFHDSHESDYNVL